MILKSEQQSSTLPPTGGDVMPPTDAIPDVPVKDFWHVWGDKFLVVALILVFTSVAVFGWYTKEADLASFASDLAKQLVSAFLTLAVVGGRALLKANGNGAAK
jgi:hypothetical protein